jgi:hypothetical protein
MGPEIPKGSARAASSTLMPVLRTIEQYLWPFVTHLIHIYITVATVGKENIAVVTRATIQTLRLQARGVVVDGDSGFCEHIVWKKVLLDLPQARFWSRMTTMALDTEICGCILVGFQARRGYILGSLIVVRNGDSTVDD